MVYNLYVNYERRNNKLSNKCLIELSTSINDPH